MCIIVAKPAGVSVPEFKTFEACFNNNPDGAGIMIAHEGRVYGYKGLMSIAEFKEMYDKCEETFGDLKSHTMVFHFRIGTHGTNSPYNTHPFPLITSAENYEAFKLLRWEADQGFAHNGIMYTLGSDPDVKAYDVSDTMVFGKKIALTFAEHYNIAANSNVQYILKQLLGSSTSKFAFIDGDGNLFTIGYFITRDGVMYSNSGYEERKITKYYSGNSNSNYGRYSSYHGDLLDYDDSYYSRPYSSYNGNKVVNISEKKSSDCDDSDDKKIASKKSTKLKRAEEMGLTILKKNAEVLCFDDVEAIDGMLLEKLKYAYSGTGILYYWSKSTGDWEWYSAPENGFALYDADNNLIYSCLDIDLEALSEAYDSGWYTGGYYAPTGE